MPHLGQFVDKNVVLRANMALALGVVWSGLAFCVAAAAIYDIRHWFTAW